MDKWNSLRRAKAELYNGLFEGTPIRPLSVADAAEPVYHLYVVRVPDTERDRLVAALNDQGIDAAVHYPVPLHLQPPLAGSQTTDLPVTEQAAGEVISLPVYPEMTDDDVHRVAGALKDALGVR